jgi:hypothetical protein
MYLFLLECKIAIIKELNYVIETTPVPNFTCQLYLLSDANFCTYNVWREIAFSQLNKFLNDNTLKITTNILDILTNREQKQIVRERQLTNQLEIDTNQSVNVGQKRGQLGGQVLSNEEQYLRILAQYKAILINDYKPSLNNDIDEEYFITCIDINNVFLLMENLELLCFETNLTNNDALKFKNNIPNDFFTNICIKLKELFVPNHKLELDQSRITINIVNTNSSNNSLETLLQMQMPMRMSSARALSVRGGKINKRNKNKKYLTKRYQTNNKNNNVKTVKKIKRVKKAKKSRKQN